MSDCLMQDKSWFMGCEPLAELILNNDNLLSVNTQCE